MFFSEIDNTLHCTFSDRLDGHVCSSLEQELLRRIAEFRNLYENVRIIFDLDEVVYVSSAFLRICLMQLRAFGKDNFIVTSVAEEIYNVFYVSGFAKIMNVVQKDI